jgi:hypothetical protein
MVNKNYLNNLEAFTSFDVSTPDLLNCGVYTITVTYQWGGFGTVTSLSVPFTLTLLDPCKAFLTPPVFAPMSGILLDPNSSIGVSPTIISPNYLYCLVSVQMTVTKNAIVDTSPFPEFTGIISQQLAVISGEIIIFHTDQYIYSYVGVYTISLLYDWSGPSTATRVFTFEVIDPCILETVPPAVIPSQTLEFTQYPYW